MRAPVATSVVTRATDSPAKSALAKDSASKAATAKDSAAKDSPPAVPAPSAPAVPVATRDSAPPAPAKATAKTAAPDSGLAAQLAALTKAVAQAQAAVAALPASPVSGIVFGSFQYHGEPNASPVSKFDLERAYLTVKLPAGDKVSVRVTADISPQASGTGYVVRAKYGFLQYDFGKSASGWGTLLRVGILHTVLTDFEEGFWPRWIGVVPNERFGNSVSADVGASTLVSLPRQEGEIYAVVTNGNGYSKPETDRFKSYAARLTLTPFARGKSLLKNVSIAPWAELNTAASKFVGGGVDQVGPVGEGLARDRFGILVGIKEPRLTVGLNYTRRRDGIESGSNTAASPRTSHTTDGSLKSFYAIVRPFTHDDGSPTRLGFVARYDLAKPDFSIDGSAHFVDAGLIVDISKRSSFALDYQEQLSNTGNTSFARTQVYALRFVANF